MPTGRSAYETAWGEYEGSVRDPAIRRDAVWRSGVRALRVAETFKRKRGSIVIKPVPGWVQGAEVTGMTSVATILEFGVTAGKLGKIYGYRITSQEPTPAGKYIKVERNDPNVGYVQVLLGIDLANPFFVSEFPLAIVRGAHDLIAVNLYFNQTASTILQASILYGESDSE